MSDEAIAAFRREIERLKMRIEAQNIGIEALLDSVEEIQVERDTWKRKAYDFESELINLRIEHELVNSRLSIYRNAQAKPQSQSSSTMFVYSPYWNAVKNGYISWRVSPKRNHTKIKQR